MKPKRVILHCSDTPPHMDIGAKEIREWHMLTPPKGNGWQDIGYHWVIGRDGSLEPGRAENKQGSHCNGENHDSIGVCLVGGRDDLRKDLQEVDRLPLYTAEQLSTLDNLYLQILVRHKISWASWSGHREHTPHKICPNLEMDEIRLRLARL